MQKLWAIVAKRLGFGLISLFVVSLVIFGATTMLPGGIAQAILGQSATPQSVAALKHELGMDLPFYVRYANWLTGVAHGDFGTSLAGQRPVAEMISGRLGNTVFLALYAAAMAVPLALILGILTALYRNSIFDRSANTLALIFVSFPEFFVAYILIVWFAQTGFFPSMSQIDPGVSLGERLYQTFLPALTLTLIVTAHMMRMTRASIINLLASPYIEMAKLKGIKPGRIILHHALPNAWAPIVNVIAVDLGYLITGVVVVEVVFVYPGLGQLLVDSAAKRDVSVVQAISLIFAAAYILLNLLADVLSIVSNPRILHSS